MISFYAIKHWVHNLKTGKFIVRNSPFDILIGEQIAKISTNVNELEDSLSKIKSGNNFISNFNLNTYYDFLNSLILLEELAF